MQDAAVTAIKEPGKWVSAGKSRFKVTAMSGFHCLVMQLPSGRRLSYPWPETKEVFKIRRPKKGAKVPDDNDIIDEGAEEEEVEMVWVNIDKKDAVDPATGVIRDGVWRTDEVSYYGQFKASQQWGRVRTHGGVFVENECQAVAADFLKLGAIRAEIDGYEPVLQVHDQLISYHHPDRGNTVEGLVAALCTLPKWAEDFPLEAVGNLAPFYRKD
jgi:DNA polymerase